MNKLSEKELNCEDNIDSVPKRRSYRINEVVVITGMSRATIYRRIKAGNIATVKSVGCTLILPDALEAFFRDLNPAG